MIKNRFLQSSSIYSILTILTSFSSVITSPLTTSTLSVSEYGVMDTLNSSITLLQLTVALGFDRAVFRLYFEKDKSERAMLISSALLCFLIICTCTTAFTIFKSQSISRLLFETPSYSALISYTMIRFPFLLAFYQFSFLLRTLNRVKTFAAFQFSLITVNVGVIVSLFYNSSLRLENMFLAMSLGQVALTCLMFFCVRKYYAFALNWQLLKELGSYAFPRFPSLLMEFAKRSSMPIFITQLASMHDTGLFAISYKLAMFAGIFVYAFRFSYDPFMMKLVAERPQDSLNISKEAYSLYILLLGPLLIFVYVATFLFPIFIDTKFIDALNIMPYLCLSVFFTGFRSIVSIGIEKSKNTKYFSIADFISCCVFLCLAYPCITYWGYLGAGLLFFITTCLENILLYLYSKKLTGFQLPLNQTVIMLSCFLLGTLITNPIYQLVVSLVFLAFVYSQSKNNHFLTSADQALMSVS